MDPLKLLKEDLASDEPQTVIRATARVSCIAVGLGPKRTVDELIPFLAEYMSTENDEALANVAQQIGECVSLVGGSSNLEKFIPILEKLLGMEETVIRDNAVTATNKVIAKMKSDQVMTVIYPLIERLVAETWFTSRVSASGLFASAYPSCADKQDELREMFAQLCMDEAPMVRRAAFSNLGAFGAKHSKSLITSDIVPIVKTMQTDPQGVMRMVTIQCIVALAKVVDAGVYVDELHPIVEQLNDDKSWRVRKSLCIGIESLCKAVGAEVAVQKVIPVYVKLLQDPEAQVRTVGATNIVGVCKQCSSATGLIEHIGPALECLEEDVDVDVRLAFSQNVGLLIDDLGAKNRDAALNLLLPIIEELSKDEYDQVRNNVVLSIDKISTTMAAADMNEKLLPSLLELAADPKWRVRMAVIDKVAAIAKIIGQKAFEDKLQKLIIMSLSDHVFAIREHACVQIGLLVKEFGGQWAGKSLFPLALAIFDKSSNYLYRMTVLSFIFHSAPYLTPDVTTKHLLPIVVQAATDSVANVRIAASQSFEALAKHVDKSIYSKTVTPLLTKLSKDSDKDVAYYAVKALKAKPK